MTVYNVNNLPGTIMTGGGMMYPQPAIGSPIQTIQTPNPFANPHTNPISSQSFLDQLQESAGLLGGRVGGINYWDTYQPKFPTKYSQTAHFAGYDPAGEPILINRPYGVNQNYWDPASSHLFMMPDTAIGITDEGGVASGGLFGGYTPGGFGEYYGQNIPPAPPPVVVAEPVWVPGQGIPGGGGEGGPGNGGNGNGGGSSCFVKGTPIQMLDGTTKPIEKIEIGDLTKGGEVWMTMIGSPQIIYNYFGVEVSGSHFVKENNKWIEVDESNHAIKTDKVEKVYTFNTTDNRIFIKDIEFADYLQVSDEVWEPYYQIIKEKLNKELHG